MNDMITSVEECKAAGLELGYPFKGSISGYPEYTAGCFWQQSYSTDPIKKFFNEDLNASPKWHTNGGICIQQGNSAHGKYYSETFYDP